MVNRRIGRGGWRRAGSSTPLDLQGGPTGRDERGSALLEFALVSPVVLLLLIGILEFGVTFNHYLALRDATRSVARQGAISVGSFNDAAAPCALVGVSGASNDVQNLMCQAKSQVNVTNTRVKVLFDNPTLTASGSTYAVGNAVVVCVTYPLTSLTNLFTPILGNQYATDKAAFRIETLPSDGKTETVGAETDPSGGSWSWCQS
jgi:Flp pilus assembly protein TadG